MDARTINKIFKTSYCLGAYYKRFKILIVTEGGPDFSASTSDNTAAFREHLHRYQWILDAFDAAAKEQSERRAAARKRPGRKNQSPRHRPFSGGTAFIDQIMNF